MVNGLLGVSKKDTDAPRLCTARSTVQNRQSGVRGIFEFDRVMEVDMLPHPWDDQPRSPSKDLPTYI